MSRKAKNSLRRESSILDVKTSSLGDSPFSLILVLSQYKILFNIRTFPWLPRGPKPRSRRRWPLRQVTPARAVGGSGSARARRCTMKG
eukprot:6194851-Pleurochrysis_carterae.AAC.2